MSYDLLPIAVPFICAYIISYALYRRNLINKSLHLRIWNILILMSLLISGIMGIVLAGIIDFGVIDPLSIDLNFWHVEVGIVLFVILFFHLHSYWSSFRNLFSKLVE